MAQSFDEPVLASASSHNNIPTLPVIRAYMAQIGKKGGSVKSQAKTDACRLNGIRPKKKC